MKSSFNVLSHYVEGWRKISSLLTLNSEALHQFWLQVDDTVYRIHELLSNGSPLKIYNELLTGVLKRLLALGDFTRAEAIALALKETAGQQGNKEALIKANVILGYTHFNLSEIDEARDVFKQGLVLLEETLSDQILRIIFLSNLSMTVNSEESLEEALACGHSALKILHTIKKPDFNALAENIDKPSWDVQRSAVMSNLGTLYFEMARRLGEGKERDAHLRRASRFFTRSQSGDITFQDKLRSQANHALVLLLQGKTTAADDAFARLKSQCDGKPSLQRIASWITGFQAESALQQGNTEKALELCHTSLRQAIQIADPVLESQAICNAFGPLHSICDCIFGSNPDWEHFQEKGMPLINELLSFLEEKDWYTAKTHSQGVMRIASRLFEVISNRISLDRIGSSLRKIQIAALLHDIGKLRVPWTVLNRTTPLWERDFNLIKKHPAHGQQILEAIGLGSLSKTVARHHERPDGLGYPEGGNIGGIADRILAVADGYEAMTTYTRIYRKPLSKSDAVKEIKNLAGLQFDRFVSTALSEAVD
ncbi:HD domain-containing protein [bacterium]|nr:HD domain-containing protein [candidate division CSSED10-310 bacterium]